MEKIWLKHYQEGVPASIDPSRYASLNAMLEEACHRYQNLPAFANLGTTLTFKAIEEKSRHFASFLQSKLKLQKGDRLAIIMPNILQFPIALFGALRAGLVVVNMNPLFTARELSEQLKDADCHTVVILENFAQTLQEVLPKFPIKNIIVTKMGDCFPLFKGMVINFIVKYLKNKVPDWSIAHTYSFNEVLKEGKKLAFTKVNVQSEDVAFLQYTSGTMGNPKGVMLTHRNLVANLLQGGAWIKALLREGKEIVITALPLYHIFSLTGNCLTFMVVGGLNVLITDPRNLNSFVKELKRYRFTAITGVNTLFNALLNHPDFKKLDFSELRLALGGGMSIQRSVAEAWQKVTKIPLIEAYGLTEASPGVCINPLNLKAFNGMVGLPISGTEVSIRDENDDEVPIGENGELCVKGPQVMKGYWQREQETEETLKNGWLHTGDIAHMDSEGFVKIVDRKKDIIIVSGFNVYPTEVEDVIALLPEVQEVAVVGRMRDAQEVVKAFVVKKSESLSKEKITEHCRNQLAAYKIPKEIEFCAELPKTNVGKISRKALKE